MTVESRGGPSAGVLARTSLFAGWSAEALEWVAGRFQPRAVAVGEVICRQGEPGDAMYVVEAGRFSVEGVIGGQAVRFAELGPGSVFGEIAVVTRRPRSATVTALAPGTLWQLQRADFEHLAAQQPSLAAAVGRLAAERLAANERWSLANEPQAVLLLQPRQDAVTIGRDAHNDVVLADPRVSRRHALLRRVGSGYRIEDLGSANGIYVNGERVDSRDLVTGDQLQIGAQVLRFDASELTHYARGRGAQVDGVDLTRVVGKGLTILNGVSLSVYPGELVAIVGGSGAGKTTLLNALSGVGPPTRGRVLYNGQDYYRHFQAFRQTLGYVPQDDIVHPELTVEKTLYYAARLRLPSDTSRAEIHQRIDGVLAQLELEARRHTEVRRVSGGQRKRVSIGVELLTEPEVFYLDEPTSGLDPGLDLRMMELLRGLADQGRTIVLTTHATRNVMLCDKVAFMARGGHLAFYGPPAEALSAFGVADFVDIYRLLEADGAAEQAAARFRTSDAYRLNVEQRLDASARQRLSAADANTPHPGTGGGSGKRGGPNQLLQLWWLTARYLSVLTRDRLALGILLAAAPILAMMMGSTFADHPFAVTFEDGGDVSQAIALIYVMTASSIFLGSFVAARSIAEESAIYARERLVNLKILPYLFSKVFGLGLFGLIQSVCLVGVVAMRLDIPGGRERLMEWTGVLALVSLASLGMGLMVSALCTNTLRAMLLHSLLLNPQLFLAGALVPLKQLDEGSKAMADMTIGRWSVSLLGYYADLNAILEAQLGPDNDYADQFSVEPERAIGAFVITFLIYLIIAMIALKRRDVRR